MNLYLITLHGVTSAVNAEAVSASRADNEPTPMHPLTMVVLETSLKENTQLQIRDTVSVPKCVTCIQALPDQPSIIHTGYN